MEIANIEHQNLKLFKYKLFKYLMKRDEGEMLKKLYMRNKEWEILNSKHKILNN